MVVVMESFSHAQDLQIIQSRRLLISVPQYLMIEGSLSLVSVKAEMGGWANNSRVQNQEHTLLLLLCDGETRQATPDHATC